MDFYLQNTPDWIVLLLSFFTSLSLCLMVFPRLIRISIDKNLTEKTNKRRVHKVSTPNLGGVAIAISFIGSILLWYHWDQALIMRFFLISYIMVVLLGLEDDISGVTAIRKLVAQSIASFFLILAADIRVTHLQGVFGIEELPFWWSVFISWFLVVLIVNSMNLIDGIDGLAAFIGIEVSLILGFWFFYLKDPSWALIAFSLAGALLGFIRFNLSRGKMKIFMGDSGSLSLGLIMSGLIILFNESVSTMPDLSVYGISPLLSVALIIVPLTDTAHVIVYRIYKGHSVFKADKRHLHHLLLFLKLSHVKASLVLLFFNLLGFTILFTFSSLGFWPLFFILLFYGFFLSWIPVRILAKRFKSLFKRF